MRCKSCGSSRILCVSAKCSDLCYMEFEGQSHSGYNHIQLPEISNGNEDYIALDYCVDCGQIQGDFTPGREINLDLEDD